MPYAVCYYQLLGVSETCTDDILKKAYRKRALELHPDKNPNDPEAKERFQLLQEAYECLSNSQDRAWYDNHKQDILGETGSPEGGDPSKINIWKFFKTSCYDRTDNADPDGEKGFYTVYRNLFQDIINEQIIEKTKEIVREQKVPKSNRSSQQSNSSRSSKKTNNILETVSEENHIYNCTAQVCHCSIPSFGDSTTEYKYVSEFYNYWEEFHSQRTFGFAEKYNLSESENRFVRRRMEAENKKLRTIARKTYNENIQHLISLLKGRDPRVKAQRILMAEKAKNDEIEKQKREENIQKLRQINRERIRLAELQKWNGLEKEKEEANEKICYFNDEGEEEENDDSQFLYVCALCRKTYKSESQWKEHIRTKKHKALAVKYGIEEHGHEEISAKEKNSFEKAETKIPSPTTECEIEKKTESLGDSQNSHGDDVTNGATIVPNDSDNLVDKTVESGKNIKRKKEKKKKKQNKSLIVKHVKSAKKSLRVERNFFNILKKQVMLL